MKKASALMISACLAATSASAADRFTVRAPIDGFVSTVPHKGSVHQPSPPPVSAYLAQLAGSLQANGLQTVSGERKPESYDFQNLHTGSKVTFVRNSGARVDALRRTIYLPGIGETPLSGLNAAGLEKLLAEAPKSQPVVAIESPVTQYQLLEAMQTLVAAQLSLDIANARLAREYGDGKTEGWKTLQAKQIAANAEYKRYSRDAQAADAKDHKAEINKFGRAEAAHAGLVDAQRLDFNVDTDLVGKARISEAQVQSAWGAVQSIEALLLLGQITCPRACKVVAVHAYPNQPVTKGDPLVDVQFLD